MIVSFISKLPYIKLGRAVLVIGMVFTCIGTLVANEIDGDNELNFTDAISIVRQNLEGARSISFDYSYVNFNRATGGQTPTQVEFIYDLLSRRGRITERRFNASDNTLKTLIKTAWNGQNKTYLSQTVDNISGYGLIDPQNPQTAGSGIVSSERPDLEKILRLFMLDRVTGLPISRALQNGNFTLSKIKGNGDKPLLEFKSSAKRYIIDAQCRALVKYEEFDTKAPTRCLVSIENSDFIEIAGITFPQLMKESIFVDPPITRIYKIAPSSIHVDQALNDETFTVEFPVGCLVKNEIDHSIKKVLPTETLNSQVGVADQLEFLLDEGERMKKQRGSQAPK